MPRTPEQQAADDALTDAIDTVWRAYDPGDDEPGLLTDYMVIAVRRGYDADGDIWTAVGTFTRDDAVPPHVQLGMLEQRRAALTFPDIVIHDEEE
ncbi:hypothetical protein [Nocardia thailandica]|uniref:hypothetical protein n=1 Tax=Nocardia thailandica TaxID=257275 RepID=UPI00031DE18C|nr:hypothetical protein [Nocardia thailandica]